MNRRTFLGACATPLLRAQTKPKNVLFIMADDLTSRGLACYGNKVVKTPNIDKLAASGMLFQRAYCQYPLCAPARASLLTGRMPDVTRVLTNGPDFRDHIPDTVTLPQLFKNNGYAAIREGKMYHMGVPGTVGTPRWQDEASWTHNGSPQGKEHTSQGKLTALTPHIEGPGVSMNFVMTPDPKEQADFDAANRAIAHLEKHRNSQFFLGLGFVRPHVPFVAPDRFFDMYPLDVIKNFENPPNDLDDIPSYPKVVGNWGHMKMNDEQRRYALRAYYASTSFMDEQLGRVIDTLDALKLRDNTVVSFMSDHGWSLGEHTHWQKQNLMEESAKVPLIISAPGMKERGKVTYNLTESLDVYPTIAAQCGLRPPAYIDGKDLTPVLNNAKARTRQFARTQLFNPNFDGRAIRTEHFRYIRWKPKDGAVAEEFYDHRKDPFEFTNLAVSATPPKDLAAHRALIPS
jgi:iduronate 2-sulfatase